MIANLDDLRKEFVVYRTGEFPRLYSPRVALADELARLMPFPERAS
jgi:hypothetical protein